MVDRGLRSPTARAPRRRPTASAPQDHAKLLRHNELLGPWPDLRYDCVRKPFWTEKIDRREAASRPRRRADLSQGCLEPAKGDSLP